MLDNATGSLYKGISDRIVILCDLCHALRTKKSASVEISVGAENFRRPDDFSQN